MVKKEAGKIVFGLIAGTIYVVFGLIQVVVGLGYGSGWTKAIFVPSDIAGGLILVLIGMVFLYGVKELNAGINEGVAYIYVGILLALGFTAIYLLIMGADALEAYAIRSEDFEDWAPLDDMKPGIYLGLLPFAALLAWRHKFSLKGLSRAGV